MIGFGLNTNVPKPTDEDAEVLVTEVNPDFDPVT
jgi:hypothetical protein